MIQRIGNGVACCKGHATTTLTAPCQRPSPRPTLETDEVCNAVLANHVCANYDRLHASISDQRWLTSSNRLVCDASRSKSLMPPGLEGSATVPAMRGSFSKWKVVREMWANREICMPGRRRAAVGQEAPATRKYRRRARPGAPAAPCASEHRGLASELARLVPNLRLCHRPRRH